MAQDDSAISGCTQRIRAVGSPRRKLQLAAVLLNDLHEVIIKEYSSIIFGRNTEREQRDRSALQGDLHPGVVWDQRLPIHHELTHLGEHRRHVRTIILEPGQREVHATSGNRGSQTKVIETRDERRHRIARCRDVHVHTPPPGLALGKLYGNYPRQARSDDRHANRDWGCEDHRTLGKPGLTHWS